MKWTALAALLALPAPARTDEAVPARPYVQASPDGAFYARCTPGGPAGKDRTTVFRVGPEKDEVLDAYDWYAPGGISLGWCPGDGKVAVAARGGPAALSVHLGGKLLAAYTPADLRTLGVAVDDRRDPTRVDLRVVGFEPVPGAKDESWFVVESAGRRLAFDPRTGKPRPGPAVSESPAGVGGWSAAAEGVRGRLVVTRGRELAGGVRETAVYVELENSGPREASIDFDPDGLRCVLSDRDGKPVPPVPHAGSGGRPARVWVTVPRDSSARLRANPYGFGRADGLLLPLGHASWHVTDGADYYLSGTLRVTPPGDKTGAWRGELTLPAVRVTAAHPGVPPEGLLPDRLNAALAGLRAGMTPDEARGVLAAAYPGPVRADGPWSGQSGYVGFQLDARYSVLVAARFDPQGRTVVSPGPRVSVVDQVRRVRLDVTPQPFGPAAEPK